MDSNRKSLLLKIISVAVIICLPMASADARVKPKAAGRTAASIPNTILSGTGKPSNTVGIDGDYFIDVKSMNIYGPKMKNKWPTAISLKGSNGVDGKSGSDGKLVTNASNVAGPSGAQGIQGLRGLPGDDGAKGEQGLRGEVGATGAQGTAGPIGTQGSIGLTGATGVQGPAGSGSQGATGITGITGAQGPAGATGAQGPAGSGATGSQGPAGATGATGSVGATGARGSEGPTGPTGATGAQGTSGVAGSTGLTGSTGSAGAQGSTGNTGAQGENGFSQVSTNLIAAWSLSSSTPGTPSDSSSFGSLAIGKTYVIDIAFHGVSTKTSGIFTAELIASSAPTYFVTELSVGEANVYAGGASAHTYSFLLHGVITVGAEITSLVVRVKDGGGHTGTQPLNLMGLAIFVMVGSVG
jgi:hypothetical protein